MSLPQRTNDTQAPALTALDLTTPESVMRDQYYRRTDISARGFAIVTATWSVLEHAPGAYSEALPINTYGRIDFDDYCALLEAPDGAGRYHEVHDTTDRAALDVLHEGAVARAQRGEIGLRTPQQHKSSSTHNGADAVAA